jgi:phenylpyruvate tautomerase PptA (4-oxalocrotonate tautomerase family)
MPFINAKIAGALTQEKEIQIKEKMGKAIELISGKSEEWLMVGFEDHYKLYFKGELMEKGAYIQVRIFGKAPKKEYDVLTVALCNLFQEELEIPADKIYITYDEVETWGWNNQNF